MPIDRPAINNEITTKTTIDLHITLIRRTFALQLGKSVLPNAKRSELMTTLSQIEKDSIMKDIKSFDEHYS